MATATFAGVVPPPYLTIIPSAALTVPPPTLSSQSGITVSLTSNLLVPRVRLSASGLQSELITAGLIVPLPLLSASVLNPAIIGSALRAPAPSLIVAGLGGNTLTAALSARPPLIIVTGYPAASITAALTTRAPYLSSFLGAAPLNAYRVWVFNTRKGVLTEYGPEFAFNSFALFNGQTLALGAQGLVVLGTQGLDNAAPIAAVARTGAESFASAYHKRVPRIYMDGSSNGDMLFRTITAEGGTRTYSLPFNGASTLQQRRVQVGKGPRSRHWQFEIANVNGADFSINDLLIYPVILRRRVQ